MPTIQDSGAILTSIGQDLADNNAGLISAEDVRHNMEDTVASIPNIVSLSDTENTYYFRNNVKVSGDGSVSRFITEGGIQFPNSPVDYDALVGLTDNIQVEPYPGSGKIDHGLLEPTSLLDDDHTQYLLTNGSRSMTGNLWLYQSGVSDPHWIGPSGNDDEGLQFDYDAANNVVINVSGRFVYPDGSTHQDVNGSGTAKGVAKAWCNFDASGTPTALPVVRSSYNIDSIERVEKGVIKITFASGTFADNNYVAIGNSNANTGSGTFDTFDINSVGLMLREGDDANTLRSIHYVIRSDDNDKVDAKLNDFVAYGLGPNTVADASPTVS
mgnify:CR=1 FL=1|tara:strand:+ start:5181 stop:6161 length:981 start_codon:yes stop_codon:yes gene_type:complete